MQNRLNSFLLYLYHVRSIKVDRLGGELEFSVKRAIKAGLCEIRNGVCYTTANTKRYLVWL